MTDEELEVIASDANRYIGGHLRLAFIAAFNPAQCLALLARLKAAEGAITKIEAMTVGWESHHQQLKQIGNVARQALSGGQHEPL